MNKERAITYSLLAHIRNTGTLVNGPIDIFIPLIKRAISHMNFNGIFQGKSILEIKNTTDDLYSIDFPVPVLKKIIGEICKELNTEESTQFALYKDGAFSINQYIFSDFDDVIEKQKKEVSELEALFSQFCESSELDSESSDSIFRFIEKNKFNLSKYISHNNDTNGHDYTAAAQFVDFFKRIPPIYERIKSIYLGSIIAGYIEYDSHDATREIELLFDTNFIIGLLDLNTPESTHTCRTLLEIAKHQKFKIRVLKATLEESTNLLETKAKYFEKSFLQKKVNPEDVYNACDRRNLKRSDLERIADNLERTVTEFGINIIHQMDKLKGEAKFTNEYKHFEKVRNSKKSAIHDAVAILHIKKQRKNRIKEFDKVNAWFVNNSVSNDGDSIFLVDGFQPESIKADDLLNILWLSNPQVNNEIEGNDLSEIGLTSTISLTLNSNLPKTQILRELDDNIHKYAKEEISDTDIVRVATRITNKQLQDIEKLNELAIKDKEQFVKRLEEEAAKQKELEEGRIKKLEEAFHDFSIRTEELEKAKEEYQASSDEISKIENEKTNAVNRISELEKELEKERTSNKESKKEQWTESQIKIWRRKTWIEFWVLTLITAGIVAYILHTSDWDLTTASTYFIELKMNLIFSSILMLLGFIFTSITIRTLFDKYRNHSNIQNYIKGLKVPENLE